MPFECDEIEEYGAHEDTCSCANCLHPGDGDGDNGDGDNGNGGPGDGDNGGSLPGDGGDNIDTGGETPPVLPISENNLPDGGSPFDPFGSNPPTGGITSPGNLPPRNVRTYYQGDIVQVAIALPTVDNVVQTPANSSVTFTFVDERFFREILFTASWNDNMEPSNDVGGILVTLPETFTATLRRGCYLYSVHMTNNLQKKKVTVEEGTICIEYAASAPDPEVPYNLPQQENQNVP
jgi:hypothetical protein